MSAEIGAISQYALAVQQMQMNLIKTNIDMQKQAVEILFGNDDRMVAPSTDLGQNLDISV